MARFIVTLSIRFDRETRQPRHQRHRSANAAMPNSFPIRDEHFL